MKTILALVLCALAAPATAADTIKLALTGPFSGGSAPMGTSTRDGSKLAIAEINAAGGVQVGDKKMKIEIIERDDEAKNERGALIAQELASMSDLSGVIGSVNTGVVMAIFCFTSFAPVMNRNKRMKLPSLPFGLAIGVSTTVSAG